MIKTGSIIPVSTGYQAKFNGLIALGKTRDEALAKIVEYITNQP